jgi:hypothetical protein
MLGKLDKIHQPNPPPPPSLTHIDILLRAHVPPLLSRAAAWREKAELFSAALSSDTAAVSNGRLLPFKL